MGSYGQFLTLFILVIAYPYKTKISHYFNHFPHLTLLGMREPNMNVSIKGVNLKQLKVLPDERGWLMEIMRCDDEIFDRFGQVYLTTAYPGVVKAWHYHKVQTDNFTCVHGMMKVVLFDARKESETRGHLMELFIGEKNPVLVTVPPGVYHGFKAIGTDTAYFLSIPNHAYNYQAPDEYRLPPDSPDIPYDWGLAPGLKHG